MPREKINLNDTMKDITIKMAEGNPGGLNFMMALVEHLGVEKGVLRILSLDDMNIRGSQIWVGYKDHCGSDIEVFAQAILDRDQDMVDTINRECYHPHLVAEHGELYGELARVHRHG